MSRPTNAAIVDLNSRVWSPFETKTASGYVTYTETAGEIHVPYGTDPVSLTIQAHELSHVRYTSKVWPNVEAALKRLTSIAGTSARIVGYAEDMRITALAGRLGIQTLPTTDSPEDKAVVQKWVESFIESGVPEDRVIKAVTFILTQHTAVLAKLKGGVTLDTLQTQEHAEQYIEVCARHIHDLLQRDTKDEEKKDNKGKDKSSSKDKKKGDPAPADDSDESDSDDSETGDKSDDDDSADDDDSKGDAGDREGDSEAEGESDGPKGEGDSDGHAPASEADLDPSTLDLPDVRDALLASVPAVDDTEKLVQTFQHLLDTSPWIPVKNIERVPLVRRAAQSRNKGRKLSETGVSLGSAYDAVAPNERRPFVAKRRGGVGGLTVVVDCSGSMRIDPHQLETLLLKHPQGVVVTYSSFTPTPELERAVVRVIASHGRLAATKDFRDGMAGANGCDGPVLEWLAKQPGERIWICDGIITGTCDKNIPYHPSTMDAWLKAHHITRFRNLAHYIKSLTPY
jgi:hypothetical protein